MESHKIIRNLFLLFGGLVGTFFALLVVSSVIAYTTVSSPETSRWFELKPTEGNSSGFFGFSEFVTILALLLIIYTVTDFKYRFRIALRGQVYVKITFWLIISVACLSLAGDYLFANQFELPAIIAHQSIWQLACAMTSIITLFIWLWNAFILPPKFSPGNSHRFVAQAKKIVMNGNAHQMEVFAEELTASYRVMVSNCLSREELGAGNQEVANEFRLDCARLMLQISNSRFCRILASSRPYSLAVLLEEVQDQERFNIPIYDLVCNVTLELIDNPNSVLYSEHQSYDESYLGLAKPLTRLLFGEISRRAIYKSPAELNLWKKSDWGSQQFQLYLSCMLEYATYVTERKSVNYDRWLFEVFSSLRGEFYGFSSELYQTDSFFRSELNQKLSICAHFIDKFIDLLDEKWPEGSKSINGKVAENNFNRSIHYYIADSVFWLMRNTGLAKTDTVDQQWMLCNITVWRVFSVYVSGPHRRLIAKLLRRAIYREIYSRPLFPSYKGAPVVGFCLNVCGINDVRRNNGKLDHNVIIRRITVPFIRANFKELYKTHQKVTETMLQGGVYYDAKENRLVKAYSENLDGTRSIQILDLKGSSRGKYY